MFKRKVVLWALALAMILGGIPGVSAQEASAAAEPMSFADMPAESYWSFASLNAAVKNGLLNGFDVNGTDYIKPEAALTRAQMATVVNRAFGAKVAASLAGVADVPSYSWFAADMGKAIHMGTFMKDTKMRPNDNITRQEAFVVLARAFVLKSADTSPLNAFSDKAQIASWALPELSAMKAAGYIQGSGGMLKPLDTITRAEFATVMDNMVKQYIDVAGTYTEVVAKGNVIVRVAGVTLDGVDVNGDLVIGDGVGDGNANLNNIAVSGRALIRGGGQNSVVFSGSATDVQNIVIARSPDGRVRILTQEGVVLAEAEVAGDSDVILEGTFGSITVVSEDVTVTALNATITNVSVPGVNSTVILSGTTTVNTVSVSGSQSDVVVQAGATAQTVQVAAAGVTVSGAGTVTNVAVQSGGDNASITTPNTVTTVATGATGVVAGGTAVPAGGTATNNSTGTSATVTQPATGGGTPAMSISIAAVAANGNAVTPTSGVYTIPWDATKDNTSIDVAISNTRAGSYNVSLTIKNAAGTTVAYASSTGLEKQYLDLLSGFGPVTFADIAFMFDRLGTAPSGYYLDAAGNQVPGSDLTAFQTSIQAAFDRMSIGAGDVYDVTVAFSGAASASVTFQVQKQ